MTTIETVSVPTTLMRALIANVSFKGQQHGKFVSAEDAGGFKGDLGCKMREHLLDPDTTCIVVTDQFEQFEMDRPDAFTELMRDGHVIHFAYTVPTDLTRWKDYGQLPEINRRYVHNKIDS